MHNNGVQYPIYYSNPSYPVQASSGGVNQMTSFPSVNPCSFSCLSAPINYITSPHCTSGSPQYIMQQPNQVLQPASIAAPASTIFTGVHQSSMPLRPQQINANNNYSSTGPGFPGSNGGKETLMPPTASTPSSQPMNFGLLSQDFKKLFLNEEDENCDLTIKVPGKEFKVHRLILKACSKVFKAMLMNKDVIDIPDIDAQAMEVLLTYVYSGEVDSLNKGNVLGVYYAANKYNMALLKKECSVLIQKSLSISIICDAIQLALNHNDEDLLKCCTKYFLNHVGEILPTKEWMLFLKANPIAANDLYIKANKK